MWQICYFFSIYSQINNAINNIDQVIQKNAEYAAETSNAVDILSEKSSQLKHSLSRFKLLEQNKDRQLIAKAKQKIQSENQLSLKAS